MKHIISSEGSIFYNSVKAPYEVLVPYMYTYGGVPIPRKIFMQRYQSLVYEGLVPLQVTAVRCCKFMPVFSLPGLVVGAH